MCVREKYHPHPRGIYREIQTEILTVWHAKREIETLKWRYSKESIIRQQNKTIQRAEREREREREEDTKRSLG